MPVTIGPGIIPAMVADSSGVIVAGVQRYGIGVPSDALGNLRDQYTDISSGVIYRKRWVANREGVGDFILFPVNLFTSVGDFDFSVRVRRDNALDFRLLVSDSDPVVSRSVSMYIEPTSTHGVALRDSAGTPQYNTTASATDSRWHTLSCRRAGNVLTTSIDGVISSTVANTSAWSPSLTQANTRALWTVSGASTSIKCCDLKLTGPGGSIIAPLNEGTGTVITNQAGDNGTLTDGSPANFWYAAWVPLGA